MSNQVSWPQVTLGENLTTVTGATPSKSNEAFFGGNILFVKPPDLLNSEISSASDTLSKVGASVGRIVPKGSVLVSCIGNLGKVGLATESLAFNQQINAIVADEKFDSKFMFYQILSPHFKSQLEKLASGTTVPIVNKSKFNSIKIILPPLNIQKSIAFRLDEAFADIDKARQLTEQNLKNAQELFESYLSKLFDESEKDSIQYRLGDITGGVSTGPFGSLLHKRDYVSNGVPIVNPAHIIEDAIIVDDRKTISAEKARELRAYSMKEGDIVIGRRGEMGRCAVVGERESGYICGTGSFVIKGSKRVHSDYLAVYLRHSRTRHQLEKLAGGAVMPNLSNKQLSGLKLYLPPFERQVKLFESIVMVSSKIDQILFIYRSKIEKLNSLKSSLLAKFFTQDSHLDLDN